MRTSSLVQPPSCKRTATLLPKSFARGLGAGIPYGIGYYRSLRLDLSRYFSQEFPVAETQSVDFQLRISRYVSVVLRHLELIENPQKSAEMDMQNSSIPKRGKNLTKTKKVALETKQRMFESTGRSA